MKKVNLFILIVICLLCTASKCGKENCHNTIEFYNNSPKDVYISFRNTCSQIPEFWLPDLVYDSAFYKVKSCTKDNRIVSWKRRNCFEYWLEQNCISIHILDANIVETVPIDTIIKYRMVLKTICPTLEEMQNSNWTVTYIEE
jgi:hypothetical protein